MSKVRINYICQVMIMADVENKTVDEVKKSSKYITSEVTDAVKGLVAGGHVEVVEQYRDVHEVTE